MNGLHSSNSNIKIDTSTLKENAKTACHNLISYFCQLSCKSNISRNYRHHQTSKLLQSLLNIYNWSNLPSAAETSLHKHEEETYLREGHERWQTSRLRTENPTETSPLLLKTSTLSHWNGLSVLFWTWTERYRRLRPSKASLRSPNVLKLLHKRPFPPKRSSHWLQQGCVSTISFLSSASCSL